MVELMASQGMSSRQIAPVLGVNQSTVVRDLAAGDVNASPDVEKLRGRDGKEYTRPERQPKPEPTDAERLERFGKSMRKLVTELGRIKAKPPQGESPP